MKYSGKIPAAALPRIPERAVGGTCIVASLLATSSGGFTTNSWRMRNDLVGPSSCHANRWPRRQKLRENGGTTGSESARYWAEEVLRLASTAFPSRLLTHSPTIVVICRASATVTGRASRCVAGEKSGDFNARLAMSPHYRLNALDYSIPLTYPY